MQSNAASCAGHFCHERPTNQKYSVDPRYDPVGHLIAVHLPVFAIPVTVYHRHPKNEKTTGEIP